MAWKAEFTRTAEKQIIKLDSKVQQTILKYLKERVLTADDPRIRGKALKGDKRGLWRYRIGSHRLISTIDDEGKMITVLTVGHKKDVYKS